MTLSSEHKILFLDLDGTLIGRGQTIRESTLQSLEAAKTAGHVLVMCTGRSVPELYPHLWDLGFSGAVTGAGGYVVYGEDILVDRRFTHADIEEASALLERLGAYYIWQGPKEMNPSPGYMDYFVSEAGAGSNDWQIYAQTIAPYVREGLPTTSTKCTAYIPVDAERIEEVRALMPKGMTVTAGSVPVGHTLVVEITPSDVSKGTGITKITRHLGRSIEETIAFGDSMNDCEALSTAGMGVAIGSTLPELVHVADLVAPCLEDDGLAWAFAKLGLLS